jgi:hypothetical protein
MRSSKGEQCSDSAASAHRLLRSGELLLARRKTFETFVFFYSKTIPVCIQECIDETVAIANV